MSALREEAKGMSDEELLRGVETLMRQRARILAVAETIRIEAEVLVDELTERTGRRGTPIRRVT